MLLYVTQIHLPLCGPWGTISGHWPSSLFLMSPNCSSLYRSPVFLVWHSPQSYQLYGYQWRLLFKTHRQCPVTCTAIFPHVVMCLLLCHLVSCVSTIPNKGSSLKFMSSASTLNSCLMTPVLFTHLVRSGVPQSGSPLLMSSAYLLPTYSFTVQPRNNLWWPIYCCANVPFWRSAVAPTCPFGVHQLNTATYFRLEHLLLSKSLS